MPETIIQEKDNRWAPDREASRVYGNKFLTITSASDQPAPGGWALIVVPQQSVAWPRPGYTVCNTPAVNEENCEAFMGEGIDQEDPFTQVDLLDSEEESTQALILLIRTSLPTAYRERLANGLVALLQDAKEEDPTSPGIIVASLRNFYDFLQSHTNLKYPAISLTPENNIYASWRDEKKRVFSVHFLANLDVRFVILTPNDRHPERQIIISGIATTDILMSKVAPYGVSDWILE